MWATKLVSFAQKRLHQNRGPREGEDVGGFSNPSIQVTASTPKANREDEFESEICRSMPLLFNLCRRWAWPAIAFRCQSHPHEAAAQDANGDTALHWAVFGKPPLVVVEALLTACPGLAAMANNDGKIPLHVAASYRASGSVIRALVLAYPEGPGIVEPKTGAIALHMMCDYGSTVEGFRAILETEAGARSVHNVDAIFQQTPLEILNTRKNMMIFHSTIRTLQQAGVAGPRIAAYELSDGRRVDPNQSSQSYQWQVYEREANKVKEGDLWQMTTLLVQAEYKGTALTRDEDATNRIVHACVGILDCPPSLVTLAVLLFPQQLVEQDDEGQVPLHKVVAKKDWSLFNDVFCPEAARICDHNGKFPLQIAAETGHHSFGSAFGDLIASHPVALECLELDERLYPFIWSKLPGGVEPLFRSIQAKPEMFAIHRD